MMKTLRTPAAALRALRSLLPCLLVGGLSAAGCGPAPVSTTPKIKIVSPLANQMVEAGKPILVTFEIGGLDQNVPFELEASDEKRVGRGRVVAYLPNNTNVRVAATQNNGDPTIYVPDEANWKVKAADVIKPPSVRIELRLEYNDKSEVTPQEPGAVTVNVR